jgi:dihydrofolate reductase
MSSYDGRRNAFASCGGPARTVSFQPVEWQPGVQAQHQSFDFSKIGSDDMAKLVFGLNQSLDGYVDHQEFAPGPTLFRHFIEQVRGLTGSIYGRRMYEVMRVWDEDHSEWTPELRDFATAWRSQPKWVVSRSLKSVGPNATLVADDVGALIRGLKARLAGEIEVGGPDLARSLTDLGLVDEYRLYLHPVVLGRGKPFFAGPRPPLRLVASDLIGEDAIRLTYVPA